MWVSPVVRGHAVRNELVAAHLGVPTDRPGSSPGCGLCHRSRLRSGPAANRRAGLGGNPALALLGVLLGSAAVPLVVVSATAPLVQDWFAQTAHPRADDPYFLYAASNAGSLLALVAYPFVIEPNLGLTAQSQIWKTGFLILAMLVMAVV